MDVTEHRARRRRDADDPGARTARRIDVAEHVGLHPVTDPGLLVPCHRVIAKNSIGGFSGATSGSDIDRKRWLLRHEGAL